MIHQTISHYPAERDAKKRHKILEKLGKVRNFLPQLLRGIGNFRIPTFYVGSGI